MRIGLGLGINRARMRSQSGGDGGNPGPAVTLVVFLGENPTETIYAVEPDGSNPDTVLGVGGDGMGIAVDDSAPGVMAYYGSPTGPSVRRITVLDNTTPLQTWKSGQTGVTGIFYHDGRIYWAQSGGTIKSDTPATGDETTHVSDAGSIRHVCVTDTHIWWAESDTGTIKRSDHNGGNVETMASSVTNAEGIAVFGDYFYFTGRNSDGPVFRRPIDLSEAATPFHASPNATYTSRGIIIGGGELYASFGTTGVGSLRRISLSDGSLINEVSDHEDPEGIGLAFAAE